MLRRLALLRDYKSQKLGDVAVPMISRQDSTVDHIAVDMGSFLANAYRVTRDLVGPERDKEMSMFINKNIISAILKKMRPRKSAAFFFDGTDPLWKTRRARRVPHKSSAQRFVRAAGSPLPFVVEDRLRVYVTDSKTAPNEILISGPATPGPAEAKISAWALDLATRLDVTPNDSVCLLGGGDLVMSALGMTPFHNISSVTMDRGDFKQTTMTDVFEWLGITELFRGGDNKAMSRIRTDATLLLLLTGGVNATNLNALPNMTFKDLFETYSEHFAKAGRYLTVDVPLPTPASDDDPTPFGSTVGLHAHHFADLLLRVIKKPCKARLETSGPYPEYLEVLLQSLAMVLDGGIFDYSFTTTESLDPKAVVQPMTAEKLAGHLKAMPNDTVLKCRANEQFAVTAAEQTILGAITADLVDEALPAFTGGHSLPPSVTESIMGVTDVAEAHEKVKRLLGPIKTKLDHRAFQHCPSMLFTRKPGEAGPPPGWTFDSVNLGVNARRSSIRATRAQEVKSSATIDIKIKNALVAFDTTTNLWKETDTKLPDNELRKTLKLVTWNVQFDRFSGQTTPLGKPGIDWCTKTRYVALSKVLSTTDADVITMQESEPTWWDYLSRQAWVQQNYTFSCPMKGEPISPWGQLMLIHKRLPVVNMSANNVPGYTGHTSVMPTCQMSLKPGINLSICGIHLLAPYTQSNINVRVTQIETLMKKLAPKHMGEDLVVMGDFNDYPSNFFVMPQAMGDYRDAWTVVHGDKDGDNGYTINGLRSKYTSLIIEPEFFGRADRMLYKSKFLKATSSELIGIKSVREELGIASCPDYLYPSDHFGISTTFDIL